MLAAYTFYNGPESDDAAIYTNDLSGHPTSIFRNQERNHVRDVAWLPEPTVRRDRRSRITLQLREHRRVGRARRNCIYRDVTLAELFSENSDELLDCGLACSLTRHARSSLQDHVA